MNFDGVDFPEQLIEAIKEDQLVIFSGAGVSMANPTKGPSFTELTNRIAQGTGKSLGKEPADKFLGSLEKCGVEVHQLTEAVLRLLKEPSELHLATLKIFSDINSVKIVTTNFEHLYDTAIKTVFSRELIPYIAPALPRGNNFHGLVHVHGSTKKYKEMVLTDKDFGNAYLKEGWAKDFLFDLFSHYTVLFVGYSHEDPIMNYLARSLPESEAKPRYILIDPCENNIEKWQLNNITSIEAPHKQQAKALNLLSEKLYKSLREQKNEFNKIITEPVANLDSTSLESVKYDLKSPLFQSVWCEKALINNWLQWADDSGLLSSVFDTRNNNKAPEYLIHWLANAVLTNPSLLFQILAKHSFNAKKELWDRIDGNIQYRLKIVMSKDIEKIAIIALSYLDIDAVYSYQRFENAIDNEQFSYAFAIIKRGWSLEYNNSNVRHLNFYEPSIDLSLYNSYLYKLIEHDCFKLLTCSLYYIQNYYDQIKLNDNYDFLNTHRHALEEHEQNIFPHCGDYLIFTLRESLLLMAKTSHKLAMNYIDLFLSSGLNLLERIGIYVLSKITFKSATEKFNHLMDSSLDKNKSEVHHEIFHFIKSIFNDLSNKEQEIWFTEVDKFEVKSGNSNQAKLIKESNTFRWLTWLSPIINKKISVIFADLKEKNPEWNFSEHPDFLSYFYGSKAHTRASVSDDLTSDKLIKSSASKNYSQLKSWQPDIKDRRFTLEIDKFDRGDLIYQVESAIISSSSWGMELLDTLITNNDFTSDLWEGLTRGFSQQVTQPDIFIKTLSNLTKTSLSHIQVVEFFNRQLDLQLEKNELQKKIIYKLLELSKELFSVLIKNDLNKSITTSDTSIDLLFQIEIRLRNTLEENYSIDFDINELIQYSRSLLENPENLDIKEQTITVIGYNIAYLSEVFLDKADYFTEIFLQKENTEPSFKGFSRRSAVPKKLFIKMIETGFWGRCFELKKEQHQYADYVSMLFSAGLFFYNTKAQRSLNKWAPIYYENSNEDELNKSSISFWHKQRDPKVKKKYWNETLKPMLENALNGVPVTISPKTFSVLNNQVFINGDYFSDLVDIITKVNLPTNRINWFNSKSKLPFLKKHKTDFCKYLAFTIFNRNESFYGGDMTGVFELLVDEGLQSISTKLDHKLFALGFDVQEKFELSIHENESYVSFCFNKKQIKGIKDIV